VRVLTFGLHGGEPSLSSQVLQDEGTAGHRLDTGELEAAVPKSAQLLRPRRGYTASPHSTPRQWAPRKARWPSARRPKSGRPKGPDRPSALVLIGWFIKTPLAASKQCQRGTQNRQDTSSEQLGAAGTFSRVSVVDTNCPTGLYFLLKLTFPLLF
jgi:hypothetical protein